MPLAESVFIRAENVPPELQPYIVDVRDPAEYASERIPGSLNIPLEKVDEFESLLARWPQIILTCQSGRRAEVVREHLKRHGMTQILLLENGLEGWKAAERRTDTLPVSHPKDEDDRDPQLAIARQSQLLGAILILLGLSVPEVGYLVFLVSIDLLAGAMINVSAISGLIGLMPWNREKAKKLCPTSGIPCAGSGQCKTSDEPS
jgi:rhodanese-related sulfurtransferase